MPKSCPIIIFCTYDEFPYVVKAQYSLCTQFLVPVQEKKELIQSLTPGARKTGSTPSRQLK
jgi:YesN/AraC family two-component response regulator